MVKHGVYKEGNRYVAYVAGEKVYSARMEHHAHTQFKRYLKKSNVSVSLEKVQEHSQDSRKERVSCDHNMPRFSINQRFSFLEEAVKMVAAGVQNSIIVCGTSGLGKTFTVLKTLRSLGYTEFGSKVTGKRFFKLVKGYSTPKGLYRLLYENNDNILVLDDCDSVWKDQTSLNLLKSALDSYDTRIICWNSERMDDDLPTSFLYTGRIIFITNLSEQQLDQAVRTRCLFIDVSMTRDEIVERMQTLINSEDFMPDFKDEAKAKAVAFISKHIEVIRTPSLRTLVNVIKIAASCSKDWENMALYVATSS